MREAEFEARNLIEFGQNGFTVVPRVVSAALCDAARSEIAQVRGETPEPKGHRGVHFYWSEPARELEPVRTMLGPPAMRMAEQLVAPLRIEPPDLVQISLNIPPWSHRPGGPHLDGCNPPEPDGRPGTFTVLAGLLLSDQPVADMGNLWVWPGTHEVNAEYLKRAGSDALLATAPYPPTPFSDPMQVLGRAGDLLLAHYLLGHNMGGNTSNVTREVVYFRLHAEGHRGRWRTVVQDAFHEFAPVRAARARHRGA
jgi:hypothetical protein